MDIDLILKDGYTIPITSKPRKLTIAIDEGRIIDLGDKKTIKNKYSGKEIDASRKIVLPGLINTHSHIPMTLLRGLADDLPLKTWLEDYIWPAEANLEATDIYRGAMLGCMELIKNGITCFNDMYFHMEQVAEVVKETGLRANLSYGMVTKNKEGNEIEEELREGVSFAERYQGQADGKITTSLAPHSPSTCSKSFLEETREKARGRIQIHLSETEEEFEEIHSKHGMTPVQYLDEIGLLSPDLLAAHSVHLANKDLGLLHQNQVKVSHNPSSNMKLASGAAPVQDMIDYGLTVSLGTDGAASNNCLNIFREMKTAALLQKIKNGDPTSLKARDALKMATINGASSLGLEDEIGSIEEGKKADIILLNGNESTLNPRYDIVSNLVYSANGSEVTDVLVDGEIIMRENSLLTLDEREVLKRTEKSSKKIRSKVIE
ncbi:MAG: Cytosine deaminase related metal-dependent hydrolase [Candidatus Methanohalarchaeum thermophilum]|uniref:5-methylthioadenosine/S-adenosylhomocysteine deaminase n=1 Tax=Methanohalarchaeum thermophilum TaxID=1903181 RepID=A0A1Q6DXT6_METT1|nr:MAG: Cytosine deaminase related metal-dependent hydrolase [Candidatus Methanohalarchaeum thermophilum]